MKADPADAAEAFLVRMIGRDRWNQLPEKTKNQRRREGRALRDELSNLRIRPPWDAESIGIPVLCGHGTHGTEHHIVGARRLASMLPNAQVVSVQDAGHGAPITHPGEFHSLLVVPHLEGKGTLTLIS